MKKIMPLTDRQLQGLIDKASRLAEKHLAASNAITDTTGC